MGKWNKDAIKVRSPTGHRETKQQQSTPLGRHPRGVLEIWRRGNTK
jgi:hypothetical protein